VSVYIIAEVGPNHGGSLDVALEMIGRLADCGADAVKFQLGTPEKVYSKDAFKAAYQKRNDGDDSAIEMSRRVQFPRQNHVILRDACRDAGLDYLCTAFDLDSLKFLDDVLDPRYFKIASGEILTVDMLDYMAERDRPILMSTGMARFDEIAAALEVLDSYRPRHVTLLHCVSVYPAPHADINLAAMAGLRERFARPVGYSDHSIGPECCLGAVALGAAVLEKHVTLDRDLPGPDHKASATIVEFAELVAAIRRLEKAIGKADKSFGEAEVEIRRMARKSITARRDLSAGDTLTRDDICYKRPGTGISPMETDSVVGRKMARSVSADRVLTPGDLE